MNRFLITAKLNTFDACLELAKTHNLGIEIQTFAFPPVLGQESWQDIIEDYRAKLTGFEGEVALHAPFMDMAPGSPDPRFIDVTTQRTAQALQAALQLGVKKVVFHANFIATIRNTPYRQQWIKRMIDFWEPYARQAKADGLLIVLENMWEFHPAIISEVVRGVDMPSFRTCLDVAHVTLFSELALESWLDELSGTIAHIHINNNYGKIDEHLGLHNGVLDYGQILPYLLDLEEKPTIALEIEEVTDIKQSLVYLDALAKSGVLEKLENRLDG
jgi:sugar phosphate isomerase/epimerase